MYDIEERIEKIKTLQSTLEQFTNKRRVLIRKMDSSLKAKSELNSSLDKAMQEESSLKQDPVYKYFNHQYYVDVSKMLNNETVEFEYDISQYQDLCKLIANIESVKTRLCDAVDKVSNSIHQLETEAKDCRDIMTKTKSEINLLRDYLEIYDYYELGDKISTVVINHIIIDIHTYTYTEILKQFTNDNGKWYQLSDSEDDKIVSSQIEVELNKII